MCNAVGFTRNLSVVVASIFFTRRRARSEFLAAVFDLENLRSAERSENYTLRGTFPPTETVERGQCSVSVKWIQYMIHVMNTVGGKETAFEECKHR